MAMTIGTKAKAKTERASALQVENIQGAVAPPPLTRPKKIMKTASGDAQLSTAKKRRTTTQAPAPVQKNTLDRWFGVSTKSAAPKVEPVVAEIESDDEMNEVDASQKPREATATPMKRASKSKKLVQRRILLSDQCRVCESAKTESSTRCERKCMECEMTVHMSCYGVSGDDEVLPEKWRCRPCLATFNLTLGESPASTEMKGVAADSGDESDAIVRGVPVHEPRGENDRFHGLYRSSDFAAVFLFLKRFRRLGLKLGVDVTVSTLASALLSPRDHALLCELHTRLLQNVGAAIAKNQNWVDNLIRFLKASEYPIGGELVRRLAACGNANDWLSTYYDVPVADRVALLKVLCEAQFDENDQLVEKIGNQDTTPESLREDTLGVDAAKRSYYLLEDPSNFLDGSAWLCRCQSHDGSQWETVSDDLASLQSFVRALSYSNDTLDLQLWQLIESGVAKSLERREKKKNQQAQRLARMPRTLRSTGLDMASILPESSGRSLRTRKAVNYRSYVDEEEEEEEEEAEDGEEESEQDAESDGEDDDDNTKDERGARSSRKRTRLRMDEPTRTSRRLRGGPPASSSSRSLRSSRRRASDSSNDENGDDDDDDDDAEDGEEKSMNSPRNDENGTAESAVLMKKTATRITVMEIAMAQHEQHERQLRNS